MKIKILTTLFVFAATAFAATAFAATALATGVMRYNAAAGTITKYSTITNTITQGLEPVTATASDGSEPPKELLESFDKAFAKTEISSVGDMAETVLEVQADGTRIVTTEATSTTKAASLPNAPALKFTIRSAYKPDGSVEIQDVKYDTDGLQKELANALEKTAEGVKKSQQAASQGLYGVAFETNAPISRAVENAGLGALAGLGITGANINSTIITTLTGRGPNGQYQFKLETSTPAFDFKLAQPGVEIDYKVEASTASGTNSYLSDGRVESSSVSTKTNMIADIELPSQKNVTYKLHVKLGIDSSTEIKLIP
jgi:hypothetical protein